ncbi:MAG: GNAT family N-acetyltransferase [Marinobacterium sp.]|nr:GNAT family N-acetyltransferase [Marinobacterium sp.]
MLYEPITVTDTATPLITLDIRPATAADGHAIVDMWMALQQQTDNYPPYAFGAPDLAVQRERLTSTLDGSLGLDTALILVASQTNTATDPATEIPVGTMSFYLIDRPGYRHSNSCVLLSVWVDPAQRRQHIAQRMLEIGRQWAKAQGAQNLQVGWHPGNPDADAFWKSQGFMGYEIIAARGID